MERLSDEELARLAELRQHIDAIDGEIIELLNSRTRLALAALAIRKAAGGYTMDYSRENEIISTVRKSNQDGPLSDAYVVGFAIGLLEETRNLANTQERGDLS